MKKKLYVRQGWWMFIAGVVLFAFGCGGADVAPPSDARHGEEENRMSVEADQFLKLYLADLAAREKTANLAYWKAANSGEAEDFEAFSQADLALKTLHSDATRYSTVVALLRRPEGIAPLTLRSLEVALLAFKGNQLPPSLLKEMVDAQAEIEQRFNTFRARLDGREMTNNDLLDALKDEKNGDRRKPIWEALKQVGEEVAPKLIALAKVRNRAAKLLGYTNFWEMQIRLQEHDPKTLVQLFDALERETDAPYRAMKSSLDKEIADKFGLLGTPLPWHYDNPFFQAAPPSKKVDLDEFYRDKPKEDIMRIAAEFYNDIGISADEVIARSDLYEREGKDQHAFCISIDRGQDVRTLLNIRPTAEWMDTALHEEGHGVFYINIDETLPYNLREANHIFVTEGVAMLFGALAKNPAWLKAYADADPARVDSLEAAVLEQRRREQLVFARWALVMFHFEQTLYQDPDQNLNRIWWDMVEKYQMIPRPAERDKPDWAAKPHFTIAPVYYHNYLLGEVFAAQLRHAFAAAAGHNGPVSSLSFNHRKDFGEFLKNKVFAPGMREPWPAFVAHALGEPLTVRYFVEELSSETGK